MALSLKSIQTIFFWATRGPLSFDFISTFILVEIIVKCIKSRSYARSGPRRATWPRGRMVIQRIANPSIPVRFWAWPPKKVGCWIIIKIILFCVKSNYLGVMINLLLGNFHQLFSRVILTRS